MHGCILAGLDIAALGNLKNIKMQVNVQLFTFYSLAGKQELRYAMMTVSDVSVKGFNKKSHHPNELRQKKQDINTETEQVPINIGGVVTFLTLRFYTISLSTNEEFKPERNVQRKNKRSTNISPKFCGIKEYNHTKPVQNSFGQVGPSIRNCGFHFL